MLHCVIDSDATPLLEVELEVEVVVRVEVVVEDCDTALVGSVRHSGNRR